MKTRFIYVRDANNFPVGCFAYRVVPDMVEGRSIGRRVEYGFSVFHPRDRFSRKTARVVAEYRLLMETTCFRPSEQLDSDPNSVLVSEAIADVVREQSPLRSPSAQCCLLPSRFCKACIRTANHLMAAQDHKEMSQMLKGVA
jgi:hypothetical protein